MNKLIAAALISFPLLSLAQSKHNLEVECFTRSDLALLLTEYGENPFAIGSTLRIDNRGADESFLIVFLNAKTQTWTIVEKSKNNLYCVLSAGSNFSLITKTTPTNSL